MATVPTKWKLEGRELAAVRHALAAVRVQPFARAALKRCIERLATDDATESDLCAAVLVLVDLGTDASMKLAEQLTERIP